MSPMEPEEEWERIDREAADWVVRCGEGLNESEQTEFEAWLSRDPRRRERVEAHRSVWQGLERLAEEEAQAPSRLAAPERKDRRFSGGRRWLGVAAAAAACLVAGVALWQAGSDSGPFGDRDEAVVRADRLVHHPLPDGSLALVKRGGALATRFDKGFRRVELLEGEAYFDVAKDPRRPFVVEVRGAEVRAVGTAFRVSLEGEQVDVVVTEGMVLVGQAKTWEGQERGDRSAKRPAAGQSVTARQRVQVPLVATEASPVVEELSENEIERLLAWKSEPLEFDGVALREVVAAFNARNRVQIELDGESLGELVVDGSFRSDNVEGLVLALEIAQGVRTRRDRAGVIVLQEKP